MVFLSASYFCAYYILSSITAYKNELKQYTIFSILVIAVTTLSGSILLGFFLVTMLCIKQTKKLDPEKKIAFFFGVVFAIPSNHAFYINPGIDLGHLSYRSLLILVLLLPILLNQKKDRAFCKPNIIDVFAILFFVWQIVLGIRGDFTGFVRDSFWLYIGQVVPYLVVRRYMGDYPLVMVSISYALLGQMFVSVCEGLTTWKIYGSFRQLTGYFDSMPGEYKFRHGFLRTEAGLGNPLILSLFSNITFLATCLLYRNRPDDLSFLKRVMFIGAICISIAGCIFTGSRAGMAGLVVALVLMVCVGWATNRKRDPKSLVIWLSIIGISIALPMSLGFIEAEFGYRYRLFVVSSDVIIDNFIFGSMTPLEDPRMEVLRQGEGIIDLVNTYVDFALHYGMTGLYLFICAIGFSFMRVYDVLRQDLAKVDKMFPMFLVCALMIVAGNLATTSPHGWNIAWLWLMVPMCSNVYTRSKSSISRQL